MVPGQERGSGGQPEAQGDGKGKKKCLCDKVPVCIMAVTLEKDSSIS